MSTTPTPIVDMRLDAARARVDLAEKLQMFVVSMETLCFTRSTGSQDTFLTASCHNRPWNMFGSRQTPKVVQAPIGRGPEKAIELDMDDLAARLNATAQQFFAEKSPTYQAWITALLADDNIPYDVSDPSAKPISPAKQSGSNNLAKAVGE